MVKQILTLICILLMPSLCNAEDLPKSKDNSLQTEIRLIAIDPGFGGNQTGPSGCDGNVYAKNINLQIARNVAERIKNDLGIDVILTRTNDVYASLEKRSAVANEKSADLLISIQTNAASDQSVSGVETYILNLAYETDSIKKAANKKTTNTKSTKDLDVVLSDLMQSINASASKNLAENVQKSICQQIELEKIAVKNRGIKQAPFAVLLNAQMPAISIYVGFLTNTNECNHLSTKEYQNNISIGIVRGIQAFMDKLSTQQ